VASSAVGARDQHVVEVHWTSLACDRSSLGTINDEAHVLGRTVSPLHVLIDARSDIYNISSRDAIYIE
jgi:hypothetical protein